MYLIDGSNLIGPTSPQELRDPWSKRTLVSKLLIFRKIRRVKITVVFDGSPDPEIRRARFDEKSFSVIFPPFGQKADTVITEIIAAQDNVRSFFVVSSDREIRDTARKKGAKILSCEVFERQLKKALKRYKKLSEMKKKDVSLSPLQVDHWKEIFGEKND